MFDHSNCGIGAIANLNGLSSHEIILQGMTLLQSLSHRGGKGHDGTGDGCGILMQLPTEYYAKVYQLSKPFAVMMAFLPRDTIKFHQALQIIQRKAHQHGFNIIKDVEVAVNRQILKPTAQLTEPKVMQFFLNMNLKTERDLYVLRREIEMTWREAGLLPTQCYIASCSSKTIVYKGLLTPEELPQYYLDLQQSEFKSNFCIVHQRFSTNTNPSWNLAQPFRYLAHNGEINTVSGNIQYSNGRQQLASIKEVYPIASEQQSDSANLDATLESLLHENFELPDIIARLLPKAYEQDTSVSKSLQAYYEYASLKQEPWDGPAGVILCDGRYLVATLDRNGLRPFRYITTDEQIILASEIGVLNTPLEKIKVASRVEASELLVVDLVTNQILNDADIKRELIKSHPYDAYLKDQLRDVSVDKSHELEVRDVLKMAHKFHYSDAEVKQELASLAFEGKEAIGSFAHTTQMPQLQKRVGLFYDYFKQNFAQVTNPPLDSIREQSVFSSRVDLTSVNSLQDGPLDYPIYRFESPILSQKQYEQVRTDEAFEVTELSLALVGSIQETIANLKKKVVEVLETNCRLIVLDDCSEMAVLPSLLATAVVVNELVVAGRRQEVRVIVKSGDARMPMHFAMLIAYGADLIYPYFVFDYMKDVMNVSEFSTYLEGCRLALFKQMAKMGISTVSSYRGSQVFEPVGLDQELSAYFGNKPSLFGGIDIAALESSLQHQDDLSKVNDYLNVDHEFATHAYSKSFIKDIKAAIVAQDFNAFEEVTALERKRFVNIRDVFEFNETASVPLTDVQSEAEIVKTFVASAMSYGALSLEAHETIAKAFNELNAMSNSGEGGELVSRFNTIKNSAIKQVASGRFGVTYDYLRSAKEIQIKMAQGAKPGEGGHLPKHKVDEKIASVRYAKQGVDLISPPPHHDIYSIEDLAQLIYDMQTVNPEALVSVKLASLSNVGTIANGVVKAGASKVVISGFNSGTGASPKSSLKYTGLPWEYGLYQTHATLRANQVRQETKIQVDGQLKSGYDVIVGAILGADEFGFATMLMVGLDCIGCKLCHTNKCPKGITTQNELLRARTMTDTTMIKTYLMFVARQTRELMARLGVSSLEALRGRTDLIRVDHPRLQLDWLEVATIHASEDMKDVDFSKDDLTVDEVNVIKSTQRTLGVNVSTKSDKPFKTYGFAGQSYGAFMPTGKTLHHTGYANDYVAKGLSGGEVVIRVDETARLSKTVPLLAGNTILYGATAGTCFIEGRVGERFAVRNSGAISINHGMGVHACEYMTGGVVVCLGDVGRNIGAGMTGGLLFLYEATDLEHKLNHQYIREFDMKDAHVKVLKETLEAYVLVTENAFARQLLQNFESEIANFKLVTSTDYYHLG